MSTSNLPIPDSLPEFSAASIPTHGDVSALTDGQGYVPDVALIERLANELFAGVPGQLAAYAPSLGSATPPRNSDLAFPLTGGDPLDLHLETRSNPAPQIPVNHAWAPGADFAMAPNLETSYPGEEVLRDLLKDNAKEHPKMTGATLYFLDEAARFNRNPASANVPQTPAAGLASSGQVAASAHPPFDVLSVRRDFPILKELVNGRPLAWLDNAATTQKPQSVIDRLSYFYQHENSNIHRAAHEMAARA